MDTRGWESRDRTYRMPLPCQRAPEIDRHKRVTSYDDLAIPVYDPIRLEIARIAQASNQITTLKPNCQIAFGIRVPTDHFLFQQGHKVGRRRRYPDHARIALGSALSFKCAFDANGHLRIKVQPYLILIVAHKFETSSDKHPGIKILRQPI